MSDIGLNGSAEASEEPLSKKLGHDLIKKVEIQVEAVLGDTVLAVSELEKLKRGSIVELDATLDQNVKLQVNGKTIALGELVAVGEVFGVRITELA